MGGRRQFGRGRKELDEGARGRSERKERDGGGRWRSEMEEACLKVAKQL